jgi:hypothetical protein
VKRVLIILLLTLALYVRAYGQLVPDDSSPAVASHNAWYINHEWAEYRNVRVPDRGDIYINTTLYTPVGNALPHFVGDTSFGVEWCSTNIKQLAKVPSLVIRGSGFESGCPLGWSGWGGGDIVQVEGRSTVATGRIDLSRQLFRDATTAVHTLPGYTDEGGTFVENLNHADNLLLDWCTCYCTCGDMEMLRLENPQSINCTLRRPEMNILGPSGEAVFVRAIMGGCVTVDNPIGNHPRVRLLALENRKWGRGYSPNNAKFLFRNVYYDNPTSADAYLKLVGYSGLIEPANPPENADAAAKAWLIAQQNPGLAKISDWQIEMDVHAPSIITDPNAKGYDKRRVDATFDNIPAELPIKRWHIRVNDFDVKPKGR